MPEFRCFNFNYNSSYSTFLTIRFNKSSWYKPNLLGIMVSFSFGANNGTPIANYQPTIGTDTIMKDGRANSINTKQHCITAMKEYEGKSLEELRIEDYLANRKGPQAGATGGFGFGATGTGLFGATSQPSAGMFGQATAGTTENKGLFGSTTSVFGQPATTGFGATATQPFGATGTAGFGATATDNSNPFGSKPAFGQTAAPSLFGQTTATSAAPAFGQTTTISQPPIFGQTALGTTENKSMFGSTSSAFGQIVATGFEFSATQPFGSTGTTGFGATDTCTSFASKPAFSPTAEKTTNNCPLNGTGLFGATNRPSALDVRTTNDKALVDSTISMFGQPATTGFGIPTTQIFGPTETNDLAATSTDVSNSVGNKPPLFWTHNGTSAASAFGSGTTAGQRQQNAITANTEFGYPHIPSYIVYLFVFLILLSFLSFVLHLFLILPL